MLSNDAGLGRAFSLLRKKPNIACLMLSPVIVKDVRKRSRLASKEVESEINPGVASSY